MRSLFPIFIIIAFPLVVTAQSHTTEAFLDSIERSVVLEEYVHTAEYKPTHVKKALHSIEVLKTESLNRRGVTNLEEALSIIPSVRYDYDPILGTQLRLRGISAANVAILVDGVPVIGRLDGAINISQIPLINVKQIEIIEGPLSTIYGNNAAKDVINIITTDSQSKKWSLGGSSQIESIGTQNHQLDLGLQTKKWYVDMHGRFFDYDKYPIDSLRLLEKYTLPDGSISTRSKYPWNPKLQMSAGTTVKYKVSADNSLVFKYDLSKESLLDYGPVKRPAFKPYAFDDRFLTSREDISFMYDGLLFHKLYVELKSSYNRFGRHVDNLLFQFQENQYDETQTKSDTTRFRSFFNKLNLSMRITPQLEVLGGVNHTFDAGKGGRIKVENPNEHEAIMSEWAYFSEVRYSLFKRFTFSYSGRFLTHSEFGNNYTSGIKAKADLGKNIVLRASYAQGYRTPDLKERYIEFIDVNHNIIGNPNLQPEKSNDIQLTIQYNPYQWMNAKLNAFRTEINDKISLFQYAPLKYNYSNVDIYTVSGLKWDMSGSWKQLNWALGASLGFWNTIIESEEKPYKGKVLDYNATLNYTIPKVKIAAMLNYRYNGPQPLFSVDFGDVNISEISAASFLDFSLNRYFWKERLQLVLGCKNILNTTYASVSGADNTGSHRVSGFQFINPGRNYFVKLGINL